MVTPRQCVADRAPGPHAANLFDPRAEYADVLSLDGVLAQLEWLPGDRGCKAEARSG